MSNAILVITDGTLRFSLITRPWQLENWIPQRADLKGGGIRRGSPLSDGSRLIDFSYANTIDTFALKAMHGEQDGVIRTRQELDRLLEKARRYWVDDWATEPVWIEARGSDETNTRYAVIKDWRMPMDDNPYAQPFYPQQQEAVMDNLALTLEHGFWQADEPGTDTAIETSAQQVYNAVTYGRAATTSREVYVANKHNEANLTHIWHWTSPAGPFGGNLIGAGLPYDLFPGGAGGPGNGDILYIGCNTALADSGPFNNVVFDILTGMTFGAGDSADWEYWNGAWVALTIANDMGITGRAFSNTGLRSIHFIPPSDWATVAVNAVTGYWIRCVITEATGVGRAQQQNRDPYSTIWPFIDIDELQVPGDLPALLRFTFEAVSPGLGVPFGDIDGEFDRVIVGARSLSRGSEFTAYMNCGDEQGLGNWTASAFLASAMADDIEAPSGRALVYTVAGVTVDGNQLRITASAATGSAYYGAFHCYMRYKVSAGATGDMRARLEFTDQQWAANTRTATETLPLQVFSNWSVLDFGRVVLPPGGAHPRLTPAQLSINLWVECVAAGAHTATFYDVILMPVDEWFADLQENLTPSSLSVDQLEYGIPLEFASTLYPKIPLHSWMINDGTGRLWAHYIPYTPGPAVIQANADQRLWWFVLRTPTGSVDRRFAEPWLVGRLRAHIVARYQSMRGAR